MDRMKFSSMLCLANWSTAKEVWVMKARVKTKKAVVLEGDLKERLELMMTCGYPIFIINETVCWPVEAEDFFTDEEMDELEGFILSTR